MTVRATNKVNQRLNKMLELLHVRGYVTIKDLSTQIGVSEMTIRRDVKRLEDAKAIKNSNGTLVYINGAVPGPIDLAYEFREEEDRHRFAKEKIGRYAAYLVEEGDVIAIDTGTTTDKIAPNLPQGKELTALCYNVNILMDLYQNPGVDILFAGGHYHANTQMFTSEAGVQFIRDVRAQKAFVSAAGIHRQLGITCANAYEVPTKKAILSSSMRKILVADSSKFGNVRSSYFCDMDEIDDIVTDDGLSEEWRTVIQEMNIMLHIV